MRIWLSLIGAAGALVAFALLRHEAPEVRIEPKGEGITIAAVGDIALYKNHALQAAKSKLRHRDIWRDTEPFLKAADITYGNLEGTLSCCRDHKNKIHRGPGLDFDNIVYTGGAGKTGLNFHPTLARSLKDAGFDVVSTANNHSADRNTFGVKETLKHLDAAGVAHTGTRRGDDERWYALTKANGFTVAWLACTEWLNVKAKAPRPFIFLCRQQEQEVLSLVRELAARPDIDAVIVTPHGGVEKPPRGDERISGFARRLINAGALAVLAGHPHHVLNAERVQRDDGTEGFVSYGRGNFITFNPAIEHRTSVILYLDLVRTASGKLGLGEMRYLPLYVHMRSRKFHVRPVDEGTGQPLAVEIVERRLGPEGRLRPTRPPEPAKPSGLLGRVGSGCDDSGDCQPPLTCESDWWDGSCTMSCDDSCPDPGACVVVEDQARCLRTCKSHKHCFDGYDCEKLRSPKGDTAAVCVPKEGW